MDEEKSFRFEFVISGIKREHADWLLGEIIKLSELYEGGVDGGFVETSEEGCEDEQQGA